MVYESVVGDFAPGSVFEYRLKCDGAVVFTANGRARKSRQQPFRVVVFGDGGVDGPGQKAIAYRAFLEHPDLVAIAGDIAYNFGRMSEYWTEYFPIYNADSASPDVGAPLARAVPFVGAIGNHDAAETRLDHTFHDELAFFAYWSLPLNGPYAVAGRNTPPIPENAALTPRVAAALGPKYPRMANYSFDFGSSHWTVLDANPYVDWTDPVLRNWVAQDLAKAGATWKVVVFHQPGFNSSRAHFTEQQMRLLSDVLEAGGVDFVLSGHVHNYQRSVPLRFLPDLSHDPKVEDGTGIMHKPSETTLPYTIDGTFVYDRQFDGVRRTVPKGIIYVITGAGGARLYTPEQTANPASWQPFTTKLVADRQSLSVIDINETRLSFRQVAEDGSVIDHFTVTKPNVRLRRTPAATVAKH
jgi:hypothetical protein